MIALAYGRVGLRDLRSRLFRWRVGVRWYAVALLTAPLSMAAILGALSLTSNAFIIITAEDKAGLLIFGLVAGLVGFNGSAGRGRQLTNSEVHGRWRPGLSWGGAVLLLYLPLSTGTASGLSAGALRGRPLLLVAATGCSWCGSTTMPRAC